MVCRQNGAVPDAVVVHFEIPGGVMAPADLAWLVPPRIPGKSGAILSGRGPVWLYGYLVHQYHPQAWVGTYERREGAAVVVESHVAGIVAGDLIPLSPEAIAFIEPEDARGVGVTE
jgi:CRISPR-associated protein Csx3